MPAENAHIRNFSIIAHIDHGKSTLADRLLEKTGTRDQARDAGPVPRQHGPRARARHHHQGPDRAHELHRARTGRSTCSTSSTRRATSTSPTRSAASLAACEGALLVVDASQGVEAQTLANVYLALDHDLEIIPVINKIDLPSRRRRSARAREIEDVIGLDASRAPCRPRAKEGIGIDEILEAVVDARAAAQGRPGRAAQGADLRQLVRQLPRRGDAGARARGHAAAEAEDPLCRNQKEFEVQELGVFSPVARGRSPS